MIRAMRFDERIGMTIGIALDRIASPLESRLIELRTKLTNARYCSAEMVIGVADE